jgi:hypothetical protein
LRENKNGDVLWIDGVNGSNCSKLRRYSLRAEVLDKKLSISRRSQFSKGCESARVECPAAVGRPERLLNREIWREETLAGSIAAGTVGSSYFENGLEMETPAGRGGRSGHF